MMMSVTEAGEQNILDVVDSDHRGVDALAANLGEASNDFDRDVECARLVREIVQHHVGCEQYLHPLIQHGLADGEQVAHQQFSEHRAMEDRLRQLELTDPSSDAFRTALAEIRDHWNRNGRYLDEHVFPQLRADTDPTVLIRLGALALAAKSDGPTRPRILAVEQPGANALISFTQGLVDKTIDSVTHHGHEGSAQIARLIQAGHYDGLEDPETTHP